MFTDVTTGTGKTMAVSTCSAETESPVQVFVQTACVSDCTANVDPGFAIPCSNLRGNTVAWDSIDGQLYFFQVSGLANSETGQFGISVFDYEPPSNTDCPDAIQLTVNGAVVSGTTVNSTTSIDCSGNARRLRGAWCK
jgi:hypothetical protein